MIYIPHLGAAPLAQFGKATSLRCRQLCARRIAAFAYRRYAYGEICHLADTCLTP